MDRHHITGIARVGAGLSAVVSCFILAGGAYAETAKLKAGTLTCKGKGGIGLIVGSKEKLDCTYTPASGGAERHFKGSITKVGLDIGVKGESVIVWTVLGSTTSLPGEALGGSFAGVAADASLGLGAGAQVLVGGNKNSVVLQPLSVKGETGINIAVGVAGLTLVPK